MSTAIPLNDISENPLRDDVFKGFTIKEKIIEYDFPILILAESPDEEKWLFKWCEVVGESAPAGRWIAFRITQDMLDSLRAGHMSLREALTLPKDKFYIFDAKSLFEPIKVRTTSPEKVPIDYLPSDDVALDGTLMNQNLTRTDKLVLRFHIFSDNIKKGKVPFPIIAPLVSSFQNYFTVVGHIINETSKRSDRIKPKTVSSAPDWTTLNLASIATGSFIMECVSNGTPQETEKLSRACELLAKISSASDADVKSLKEQVGEEGLHFASALAQCVANLDVAFSIKWTSPDTPNGYLVIDKRRAQKFIDILESQDQQFAKIRNITITLTDEEAEPIRKEIRGEGGMQSLLRGLQKKLDKKTNTVELTPAEIEKILRYGLNYGQGGFQGRLGGIAKAIRRISSSMQTS